MRKIVINVMMGLLAAVVFAMAGCGGGSGSSTLPATTQTANTAMFSGKSFKTSDGVITFNPNGAVSGAGSNTNNETWTINSSGQLVIYNTGKGTSTFTLVSGDATHGWTVSATYSDGTAATLTLVPANVFTTAMISGKSFIGDSGTFTFIANGTLSGAGSNTSNETWIINSSGQLVIYNTGKGTATFTLVSGDAIHGWTVSATYSNGTAATLTLVPA